MQKITINKRTALNYRSAESYKALRTNIQFSGDEIKVISVTSCAPNEGKSSVAINLSLSLAEAGKSVLFIDADMRKSMIVGRYRISQAKKGLSHYLSGQCKVEDAISITNIDKFHMIVAGPVPPNPSELLQSRRFEFLLRTTKKVYDYVIIDTPPIGSVIDSAIISKHCDGSVLVIVSGQISYKVAQKAKSQLEMSGCKILGAILNKVDIRTDVYYKKYYGKYYGDYYGKDDQKSV